MKPHKISKNISSIAYQISLSGLLVIVACVVLGLFFYRIGNFAPTLSQFLMIATWLILIIIWGILSIREYLTSTNSNYTLLENSLSVLKTGLLRGVKEEHLYRYDTIQSVSSTSYQGDPYGTVTIFLDQQKSVTLKHVANPSRIASEIKQLASKDRRQISVV